MFSNTGKPMTLLGTYVGSGSPCLRPGHEYKFSMRVQPLTGYWEAMFMEPQIKGIFSCIDALYKNFMHIRMVMEDGHIVAF